jgi:hypothetical protein
MGDSDEGPDSGGLPAGPAERLSVEEVRDETHIGTFRH